MTPARPRNLAQEIGKARPFEAAQEEAYLNLLMTVEHLSTGVERLIAAYEQLGLSPALYNVLRIVAGHQRRQLAGRKPAADGGDCGVPVQRIAAEMVTRQPDITRLVDRLEKLQLATRRRCHKDRRVVYVELTERGRRAAEALRQPLIDLHRRQLGHLSDRDLGTLNRLLFKARHSGGRETD